MSFSGKRYRRVRSENIDALFRSTIANEKVINLLKSNAPVFSFTRINETTMKFALETEGKVLVRTFILGQEHEMERIDGMKIKLTYTLEGDDILNQIVKQPDGEVFYFKREFFEKDTKMIITNKRTNVQAAIYYELVQEKEDR